MRANTCTQRTADGLIAESRKLQIHKPKESAVAKIWLRCRAKLQFAPRIQTSHWQPGHSSGLPDVRTGTVQPNEEKENMISPLLDWFCWWQALWKWKADHADLVYSLWKKFCSKISSPTVPSTAPHFYRQTNQVSGKNLSWCVCAKHYYHGERTANFSSKLEAKLANPLLLKAASRTPKTERGTKSRATCCSEGCGLHTGGCGWDARFSSKWQEEFEGNIVSQEECNSFKISNREPDLIRAVAPAGEKPCCCRRDYYFFPLFLFFHYSSPKWIALFGNEHSASLCTCILTLN